MKQEHINKDTLDVYQYTVKMIYHSGASITKRGLTASDVERIIDHNEETNKFKHLIISKLPKN